MAGGFFTAVAAAATLALGQPGPARPAIAHPALWAVQDEDTTIFLFGTFHALDERSDWFRDNIRVAFTVSDELVLETLLPQLDRNATLPQPTVTPTASFLGATRMAVHAGRRRGLDVRNGADMVLRWAADDFGKPVSGLETVQFQLGMLGRMSGPRTRTGAPLAMDEATTASMAAIIAGMQGAWENGDQRIFSGMLDQMRQSSPGNYRAMFPERNARWADWIVDRMAAPGVVFVAVGAAHFAGSDSVLANLQAQGLTPKRIN